MCCFLQLKGETSGSRQFERKRAVAYNSKRNIRIGSRQKENVLLPTTRRGTCGSRQLERKHPDRVPDRKKTCRCLQLEGEHLDPVPGRKKTCCCLQLEGGHPVPDNSKENMPFPTTRSKTSRSPIRFPEWTLIRGFALNRNNGARRPLKVVKLLQCNALPQNYG
ncbi:hypothetical protein BV22DRAFT_1154569 [Leucogyrophana mollusca]|uniref:Uncharacterized protein n=1 Tax=Leucogyrophana mollusca TaxID=85980 RepID=A0ACB8BN26_9AGAM|nr:hypothetical protein BV22DRAFT_1154569 [Leucogyrophana mollusca]